MEPNTATKRFQKGVTLVKGLVNKQIKFNLLAPTWQALSHWGGCRAFPALIGGSAVPHSFEAPFSDAVKRHKCLFTNIYSPVMFCKN